MNCITNIDAQSFKNHTYWRWRTLDTYGACRFLWQNGQHTCLCSSHLIDWVVVTIVTECYLEMALYHGRRVFVIRIDLVPLHRDAVSFLWGHKLDTIHIPIHHYTLLKESCSERNLTKMKVWRWEKLDDIPLFKVMGLIVKEKQRLKE